MEQYTQSEYTVIRRSTAIPVQHTELPAQSEEAKTAEPKKTKVRKPLSGESKLLLMQTAAGLVLLLAVAAGAALGGGSFRAWYREWMAWRSVDLPALVEPIEPESLPMPESDGTLSMRA